MPSPQDLFTNRKPAAVAEIVLQYDPLITSLSSSLQMRKALIQTVLGWELACLNPSDQVADAAVMSNHGQRIATGIVSPVASYDSSTGLAQITADSAINATNWAKIQGLSSEPQRDVNNLNHIFEVWGKLHDNNEYNIRSASLRVKYGAFETGINGSLLKITSDQARVVLGGYNDAGYGIKIMPIYEALEAINREAKR